MLRQLCDLLLILVMLSLCGAGMLLYPSLGSVATLVVVWVLFNLSRIRGDRLEEERASKGEGSKLS